MKFILFVKKHLLLTSIPAKYEPPNKKTLLQTATPAKVFFTKEHSLLTAIFRNIFVQEETQPRSNGNMKCRLFNNCLRQSAKLFFVC